jgi:diguanylate cyclase (GGDEF)-like protein
VADVGNRPSAGEVSGLIAAVLVLYAERALGPEGVKEVMDRVGAERVLAVVEHWETWVEVELVRAIALVVAELCHEPDIGRRTGEELFRVLQERGQLVVPNREPLAELLPAVVASIDTASDLRRATVVECGEQAARVQVVSTERGRTRFWCRLLTGMYALIPTLRGFSGTAVETRCVNRGDELCEFQLRWRPRVFLGSELDPWHGRVKRLQEWAWELAAENRDHAPVALEAAALLEEIQRQTLTDPLTGAGNRAALERRVHLELDRRGSLDGLTLLFVDLDGFKAINDTWGHTVGDELLVQLTARLKGAVRSTDLVVRLGGDEFVVLFPSIPRDDVVQDLVGKVIGVFDEPYPVGSELLSLRGSVGISRAPKDGRSLSELLHHADHAMYRVKRARKGLEGVRS